MIIREYTPGKGNGITKVEMKKISRQVQKLKNSSFWMERGLGLKGGKMSLESMAEARWEFVLHMVGNWEL